MLKGDFAIFLFYDIVNVLLPAILQTKATFTFSELAQKVMISGHDNILHQGIK